MIDIIQMPDESKKFGSVLECIGLRKRGREHQSIWIGQSENCYGELEDTDRCDSYHIVNHDGNQAMGYARLIPLEQVDEEQKTSKLIFDIAEQCHRLPAFELQRVSTHWQNIDDIEANNGGIILREMLIEAFRIANIRRIKFLFTTCDHAGTAAIKQMGLKYSTLSTPFVIDGRVVVVICIAVTNQNFSSLSPLKIVGSTQAQDEIRVLPFQQKKIVDSPSELEKFEALAALMNMFPSSTNEQ